MRLFQFRRATLVAACLEFFMAPAFAELQPQARLGGELLPVVACREDRLVVLKKGKKHTVGKAYELRPGPAFAEGFVEIQNEVSELDPLRDAPMKVRTHPSAVRFRYRADVLADRTVSDCYGVLTFVAQGSVGSYLFPIGRLSKGKPKDIKVELRSEVDAVGSLHVFAGGLEMRTTHRREAYDARTYLAKLVSGATALSAAELLKFEENVPHELSHDGDLLATVRQRDAKKTIIVYDLRSMKLLCEKPAAEADDYVADLTWISEHEVAFIAEDDLYGRRSEYNLHVLDIKTGEIRRALLDVFQIILSLPEKPEVLVLARGGRGSGFVKYDVRTGKTFDFEEPSYGTYLFDQKGNARVRTKTEGDKRIYYCRPTPDGRWREIDDIVKEPGLRFNVRAAELLDRTIDIHSVGPDGDILYISVRNGTDRFELAAFSMSEGVIKGVIARHPRYDLTKGEGDPSRLLFAKNSSRLLGILYQADKLKVSWLDQGFANVQKNIEAQFPDQLNLPIDWSHDGSTFIYFSGSDRNPGIFYVYRPLEGRLVPLLDHGERLKNRTLARTTPFEFAARDGQKIPAYLTLPPPPMQGPYPLIVDVHGGPTARDYWYFDGRKQFFASRGYAILEVNYRGSSGYGAAFQNAGLRARIDTVILDDIADGTRHLIAQGDIDPERVAIMGVSFGGWATYISLAKYPELYRTGVAISAVSSWRQTLRDDRWRYNNQVAYSFWKTLLAREDFEADLKFIDPLTRASEIKQPIFIVHGERDEIVHPIEAKMMLEALRKTNPRVKARAFAQASHSFWPFSERVEQLNEIASFLDESLPRPNSKPESAVNAGADN